MPKKYTLFLVKTAIPPFPTEHFPRPEYFKTLPLGQWQKRRFLPPKFADMFTGRTIPAKLIWQFAWRYLLFYLIWSGLIVVVYVNLEWRWAAVPFLPIGIVGTAVAFYVGFKNNASYERLWEARRIWGSLVNASRTFGVFVLDYVDAPLETKRELIYRQLAYLNTLRVQLRKRNIWERNDEIAIAVVERHHALRKRPLHDELAAFLPPAEIDFYAERQNPPTQVLRRQSERLAELQRAGALDDFRHMEFGRIFQEFYNQQGACERIKSFPFPRQYAHFSKVFTWIFVLLLPFGLVNEFAKLGPGCAWLAVPFHMLVSWIFVTMELVGDASENPFENGINDIPMTAICRNVEIDLREMLGETELPARIQPVNHILM